MPNPRKQLTTIMTRDGRLCGIHMGGCGSYLPAKSDASVDHMISRSFIGFMPADRRKDFYFNWNTQPMCKACNNVDKGGQLNGWPLFKCGCHYLQVHQDENMYVHERTGSKERTHLLVEGAVGDGSVFRLFASKLPGDGNQIGWSGDLARLGGHLLVPIPRESVEAFDWFELARIGEARGRFARYGDSGEKCVFLPSGEIVPISRHGCAKRFPVDLGHHNLRYDPFRLADENSIRSVHSLRKTGREIV